MARRSRFLRRGGGPRISRGVLAALALLTAGAVLVGLQTRVGGPGQGASAAGDDVAAGVGRWATLPARAIEDAGKRALTMWSAAGELEDLRRENAELRAWRAYAEQMAERNARYEALLGMPDTVYGDAGQPDRAIAAQLVLDAGGPFRRTLVANAGAEHGVAVGFVVINENGLIGRVVSVGRRSARVMLLDDDSSRVPVMGASSRVRAVLVGQGGRRPRLATQPMTVTAPSLEFIVGADSLLQGEPLVTSGDGGLYPRGIPVGVARVTQDGGWRVDMAASRNAIDYVRIIPYVALTPPDEGEAEADPAPPPAVSGPRIVRVAPPVAVAPAAPALQPVAAARPAVEPPRPTVAPLLAPQPRVNEPPPPPASQEAVSEDAPPPAPDAARPVVRAQPNAPPGTPPPVETP